MAEKFKPEYIYADAEEKYVKAVVLYLGGDPTVLYYDEACEHPVNGADVLNFFLKGLFVSDGTTYYSTTSYDASTGTAIIGYGDGSTAKAEIVTEE